MKTGILFDLDGTLLNTLEDLVDATNYALAAFGHPPRTRKEVRRFLGNGAENQIRLSLPDDNKEDLQQVSGDSLLLHPEHKCRGNSRHRVPLPPHPAYWKRWQRDISPPAFSGQEEHPHRVWF